LILFLASQHYFIQLCRIDREVMRNVLGGLQHRVLTQWIATKIIHYPVFMLHRPAAESRLRTPVAQA
jgi:hypothetical protein|tara:strand:- start:6954 stop:7154 length:201 start_codon:yes stop_codon:yes gene_type:complete